MSSRSRRPIATRLAPDEPLAAARSVAKTLMDWVPGLGVVVIDLESRIQKMEGNAHGRHGGGGDVVGRFISDVLPQAAWEAVQGPWSAALRGETDTLDWASLDGEIDYVLHFSPLRDSAGAVVGAVMTAQDITERWEAYRRIERRAKRQTAIAELGSMALRGEPTTRLVQDGARLVSETIGADVTRVFAYAAGGAPEVRGISGKLSRRSSDTLGPAVAGPLIEHMRDADSPLLIADLRAAPLKDPSLEARGMLSVITAPIGRGASQYGAIEASSARLGAFSRGDLSFVQSISNVLAEAVMRERTTDEAAHREAQLNEAQRLAGIGSWEVDLATRQVVLSQHLAEMLGIPEGDTDPGAMFARIHDEDRSRVSRAVAEAAISGHSAALEFRVMSPDGVRLFKAQGTGVPHGTSDSGTLRGTVQDVTEARLAEQKIRRSEERFRQGFDNAPIGMTLVDPATGLFVRVNDAYCRMMGRTAAELLTMTWSDVVHPDDVTDRRTDFGAGLTNELVIEGRYVRSDGTTIWAKINASRVLDLDGEVDVLFSQVEDVTERRGREEAIRVELEGVAWVREIHAALAEDRFELYAQPIVDLATDEVIQHELLLRMHSTTGALIAPGEFLPTAEQYGVIRDIDRWVIGRGAELAAGGMNVEINLSGTSMGDIGLIDEIDRALERTGADPSKLVFEITETTVIESVDTARRLATLLRDRGCRFALDDFGTGFAGISSLKTLPLDYLKIDREFVRDICTSETDRRVITATIDLARAFGLQTIAEGVEDKATLDLLRSLGIDLAQGYFLGRPAPIPS